MKRKEFKDTPHFGSLLDEKKKRIAKRF